MFSIDSDPLAYPTPLSSPRITAALVGERWRLRRDADPLDQIPRLNVGDGRRHRLGRAMTQQLTKRECIEAESWLNLTAGALR